MSNLQTLLPLLVLLIFNPFTPYARASSFGESEVRLKVSVPDGFEKTYRLQSMGKGLLFNETELGLNDLFALSKPLARVLAELRLNEKSVQAVRKQPICGGMAYELSLRRKGVKEVAIQRSCQGNAEFDELFQAFHRIEATRTGGKSY
ncbi:MAG: hypothetical protein NDJ90_04565 [Oligoflexia bacterium]|nr:hypothetical protein [Oligoflexia bacterium]